MTVPDRTAVVTGATRGLGRALALAFARRRYVVYGTARHEDALRELAAGAADLGLDLRVLAGDVSQPEDNARLAQRLREDERRVDVLVHCAGLLGERVELAAYPPEIWNRVLAVNLTGPFDLTRQLVPLLHRRSVVQFVTSGVSLTARERWGAYNVSKIALDGLARIWARELEASGVRVFLIDPGRMRTGMRAAAYPEEDPARVPLPEEKTGIFLRLVEEGTLAQTGQRFEAGQEVHPGSGAPPG